MVTISEKQVFHRLEFDNPWWAKGAGIDKHYSTFKRRLYFQPLMNLVRDRSVNRAVVIMGSRRVGKTVIVFQAIQDLLDSGVDGHSVIYASLDTPLYSDLPLEKILMMFQKRFNHAKDSNLHIFFDEVQYLRDWEVHLKSLVDSFPAYTFIVTGSAAAALKLKSRESGAGRFTEFILPPLTFSEYIHFIGRKEELIKSSESGLPIALNIAELNREFCNYLNYGGYPEAVFSATIQKDLSRYIKSDIIDKVLLRDLPSLYGISDIQELNRLFTTLAYNTGMEISLENLSKGSGVAKNTIKRYLEYLEAAFLIRRVNRIDQNSRHFKRVILFKVYLTNPSMRSALFGQLDPEDPDMGHLVETAIYSQWLHSLEIDALYFARWQSGEIDLVFLSPFSQKAEWIVEVKWSDSALKDNSQLENCVDFVRSNGIGDKKVLITTRSVYGELKYKDVVFEFVPSSMYAYIVGETSLRLKNAILLPNEAMLDVENGSIRPPGFR